MINYIVVVLNENDNNNTTTTNNNNDQRVLLDIVISFILTIFIMFIMNYYKRIQQFLYTLYERIYLYYYLIPTTKMNKKKKKKNVDEDNNNNDDDENDDDDDIIISGLYVYPVKSTRAVSCETIELDQYGFKNDRRFMVVIPMPTSTSSTLYMNDDDLKTKKNNNKKKKKDDDNDNNDIDYDDDDDDDIPTHRFLTQRQCPSLATVVARIGSSTDDDDDDDDGTNVETLTLSSHLLSSDDTITIPITRMGQPAHLLYRARIFHDVVDVIDMGNIASTFFHKIIMMDHHIPMEMKSKEKQYDVRLVMQYDNNNHNNQQYQGNAILDGQEHPIQQQQAGGGKTRRRRMPSRPRYADSKYIPSIGRTLFTNECPVVTLNDGFPLLIASESSLDDVNEKLQQHNQPPIPMNRFRPNIVVKGGGRGIRNNNNKLKPFIEDTWKIIQIVNDDHDTNVATTTTTTTTTKKKNTNNEDNNNNNNPIIMYIVKGCPRCKQSCTDQITGQVYDEPLNTLRTYRSLSDTYKDEVYFAQNAILCPSTIHSIHNKRKTTSNNNNNNNNKQPPMTISVGQRIRVLKTGQPIWGHAD